MNPNPFLKLMILNSVTLGRYLLFGLTSKWKLVEVKTLSDKCVYNRFYTETKHEVAQSINKIS